MTDLRLPVPDKRPWCPFHGSPEPSCPRVFPRCNVRGTKLIALRFIGCSLNELRRARKDVCHDIAPDTSGSLWWASMKSRFSRGIVLLFLSRSLRCLKTKNASHAHTARILGFDFENTRQRSWGLTDIKEGGSATS